MTVYKLIEVVGTSRTSFSDAVRAAVHRSAQTIEDLRWFEVKEMRGRVEGGEIEEYQVKVHLAFHVRAASDEKRRAASAERAGEAGPTRQARSMEAQTAKKAGAKAVAGIARSFERQPGPPPARKSGSRPGQREAAARGRRAG